MQMSRQTDGAHFENASSVDQNVFSLVAAGRMMMSDEFG